MSTGVGAPFTLRDEGRDDEGGHPGGHRGRGRGKRNDARTRIFRGRLADLPAVVKESAIRSPALLFVGEAASRGAEAACADPQTVKELCHGPVAESV